MFHSRSSRARRFSSRRFRFRQVVVACVVAAVAVVLSACGSSGSSHPAASASAGSLSGAAIKVGFICSCTGSESSVFGDNSKVAQLWASTVNDSGGINGHPVQLFAMDDGGNPSTALQDAKTLVQQDHVIAMVGESSSEDATWIPWVVAQGVPEVGGIDQAIQTQTPDYFGDGTNLPTITAAMIDEATGKQHLGLMYCTEIPDCQQTVAPSQKISQLFGLKFSSASISATAPSYAAPCLQMKGEGVGALLVADDVPVTLRLLAQCAQQGFTPLFISATSVTTPMMLASPQVSQSILASTDANIYDSSTPGVKEFQDALNKAYPGLLHSSSFAYGAVYAWIGGELFEAAAKAADIGPSSTPADVMKGLYSLKDETLGGLTPPLTYTPGQPTFTPCWFTMKDENGTVVSLNGDKPVCLSPAQLTQLKPIVAG
jgi:branched-chain amino acid transport system substrate-binding protein